MARVGLKECVRMARSDEGLVEGRTGSALGVLYGIWWWIRGVPDEWIDPDDPRRLRRDR